MTTPLNWPTTLEGAEGLTTRALGERGAVDALGIGALIWGGETPPSNMDEVGVEIPSLVLNIPGLKETPATSELKGRTWAIIASFSLQLFNLY